MREVLSFASQGFYIALSLNALGAWRVGLDILNEVKWLCLVMSESLCCHIRGSTGAEIFDYQKQDICMHALNGWHTPYVITTPQPI